MKRPYNTLLMNGAAVGCGLLLVAGPRAASGFASMKRFLGRIQPKPVIQTPVRRSQSIQYQPSFTSLWQSVKVKEDFYDVPDLQHQHDPINNNIEDDVVVGSRIIDQSIEVPTKMSDAFRVFFFSGDYGPSWIVLIILGLCKYRFDLASSMAITASSFGWLDIAVFVGAILFWWIQEHVLHDKILHSKFDWVGKQIHQQHHAKPYYHVSVDTAPLLLSWMTIAHFILFRWWLPLPIAISATIGYSIAGLFYEWAHYIVHTKVRFKGIGSNFWIQVRDNHIRHHRISSNYWYAFSLPLLDDIFRTNPSIKDVQSELKRIKYEEAR